MTNSAQSVLRMLLQNGALRSGDIVRVEDTAERLGLSLFFLGVIVLPLAGNAAEYASALYFARRDRMGLVMTISVGSSIQIALMTAPALVLGSYAFGHPMDLVFGNPLDLRIGSPMAMAFANGAEFAGYNFSVEEIRQYVRRCFPACLS